MLFVYAYVDMSWDAQSMLYVGTALGLIGCLERLVAPIQQPTSSRLRHKVQQHERLRHV